MLILVPCRNEAATLPGLIDSLARLNYPANRLRVALIDDGSRDTTRVLIELAAEKSPGWWAIAYESNRGKPQALNDALAQIGFGDVIVIYDADHRPESDSLKRLVAAFDDPVVAGASGRTLPINPTASLPAYYATVESLVHQMITMQAKDRLDLAPALLGSNCAYRRSMLEQAGGFRRGSLIEDGDLTLAFARLGYRLRFVPESIAWHQVPETVDGYLQQHLRWA
ncbi:MAG: glycosyltransferase, partial [Longimicrobiales bacterium]